MKKKRCNLPQTEGNKQQKSHEQGITIFQTGLLSYSCLPDDEIKLRSRQHQHPQQRGDSPVEDRREHVLQGEHGPAVLVANGREEGLCNRGGQAVSPGRDGAALSKSRELFHRPRRDLSDPPGNVQVGLLD